jgi:hypothetical protein
MERLILATAGAADLIQPMDKVSQRKRRNLATGGVANLIQLTTGRVNQWWDEQLRRRFSSNHHPRKPITTLQAPSIDRLDGQLIIPCREIPK